MKKIVSLIMAVVMALTMIIPVSADSSDAGLKSAMTIAKQRFEIPEACTEFDYSKYTDSGRSYYDMQWHDKDYKQSVQIIVSGKIIFSVYNNKQKITSSNKSSVSFGKLSREEILAKAKSWIKQLNPTVYSQLTIDEDSFTSSIYGDSAVVKFNRTYNGINVYNNNGSVSIDKNTGDIYAFSMNWCFGAEFNSDKAISLSAAKKAIKSEYGLEPVYRIVADYDKQQYNTYLIYTQTTSGDIDAFTGKLSDFEANFYGNGFDCFAEEDAADENPTTGGGDNGIDFTEEELKSIEANKNLLTVDEIEKLLKENSEIALTDKMNLNSSNLYHARFDEDTYYWNLQYRTKDWNNYLSVTVDAQSGKIVFLNQNSDYSAVSTFDEAAAIKKAESFAKAQTDTKKFAEYKLYSSELSSYPDTFTGKNKINGIDVYYYRYVNDVRVANDYIHIFINSKQEISDYEYAYTKVEFPSAEMLTANQAFNKLFTQIEPTLSYKCNISNIDKKWVTTTALLYSLDSFTLDAKTGEMVDWYYCQPVQRDTNTYGNYTDIEDKALLEKAELLEDYGVALPTDSGKLNPDSNISESDFANLLNQARVWYYASEKPAATISRQKALKSMISAIYGDDVTSISGIFKSPFTDVKDSSKYAGYCAVANAKGIVTGTKFRPTDKLTKAEALTWVYNYILNN